MAVPGSQTPGGINYSQYSGMSMPDIFTKAGFGSYGTAPAGWDWGKFQAATGIDPNSVDAAGRGISPSQLSLWDYGVGGGTNAGNSAGYPTTATRTVANPALMEAGSSFTGNPSVPSGSGVPPPTASAPPPAGGSSFNRTPFASGGNTTPYGASPYSWPYTTPGGGGSQNAGVFDVNNPGNIFGNSSTSQLNPALQNAFTMFLQQAMTRYSDPNGMQYYSGQLTPGLTPTGAQGQQMLLDWAKQFGGTLDSTNQFYNSVMGQGTNPGQNPQLDAAVNAMRASANQQFTNPGGPLATIRSDANNAGQYGGTRQGVAEGVAAGQEATGLDSAEAQMRYQGYQDAITNALRAQGLLPQLTAAGMAPGLAYSSVDAQNRGISQSQNNDALNAWLYNTTEPDVRLQNLQNAVTGALPLGGTTYNQTTYPGWYTALMQAQGSQGAGGASNALGGAAGLYALWQLFNGGGK